MGGVQVLGKRDEAQKTSECFQWIAEIFFSCSRSQFPFWTQRPHVSDVGALFFGGFQTCVASWAVCMHCAPRGSISNTSGTIMSGEVRDNGRAKGRFSLGFSSQVLGWSKGRPIFFGGER